MKVLLPRTEFIALTIIAMAGTILDRIRKILSDHAHITIHFINHANNLKNGTTTFRLRISHREPVKFEGIIGKLNDVECIAQIRW